MNGIPMEDVATFDKYLFKTLHYLAEHWHDSETGIVACCLKDKQHVTFATSTKHGNHWKHAERNAYDKFKRSHGEPSADAAFITTLSPCVKDLKYRREASCAELIKSLGVKRIHFGVLDTMHLADLSDYKALGFAPSLTAAPSLSAMCLKLMSLFSTYDSKINTELPSIKRSLGEGFFSFVE
jgi:pyrimidine deaminase RibD-like protein